MITQSFEDHSFEDQEFIRSLFFSYATSSDNFYNFLPEFWAVFEKTAKATPIYSQAKGDMRPFFDSLSSPAAAVNNAILQNSLSTLCRQMGIRGLDDITFMTVPWDSWNGAAARLPSGRTLIQISSMAYVFGSALAPAAFDFSRGAKVLGHTGKSAGQELTPLSLAHICWVAKAVAERSADYLSASMHMTQALHPYGAVPSAEDELLLHIFPDVQVWFLILHELAHIKFNHREGAGTDSSNEMKADQFALDILMQSVGGMEGGGVAFELLDAFFNFMDFAYSLFGGPRVEHLEWKNRALATTSKGATAAVHKTINTMHKRFGSKLSEGVADNLMFGAVWHHDRVVRLKKAGLPPSDIFSLQDPSQD